MRGNLSEKHFPELLLEISEAKETGVLSVRQKGIERQVFFQDGSITFAKSNDPDDRLGSLLLRHNRITYRQYQEAAVKVTAGKRLGTVLVLDGYITPTELSQGVIDQIREILFSMFAWSQGEFEFQRGPLSTEEVIALEITTPDLILAGLERIRKWSWISKGSISLDAVIRKREGWSRVVRKMNPGPEVQSVIDLLDRPRTLEEILQISPFGNFDTCRMVWALLLLGIAEQILGAPQWSEPKPAITAEMEAPAIARIEPPVSGEETLPISTISKTAEMEIETPGKPEPLSIDDLPAGELEIVSVEPQTIPPATLSSSPVPSHAVDLSFADLAELTDDSLEEIPQQFPMEKWDRNLEADILRLNSRHRYLFEMLQIELGAGVANFMSRISRKTTSRYPLIFEGVRMNEFGEFHENSLIANIQGNMVENYPDGLDFLFQEEFRMLRSLLEARSVEAVESCLAKLGPIRKTE